MISTLLFSLALQKTILFIGDSHIPGPFGKQLDTILRNESPYSLETDGVCGATATYFLTSGRTKCGYFFNGTNNKPKEGLSAPSPLINPLLRKLRPEWVFVELGSNYAEGWTDAEMIADMKNLAKTITVNGSKCIWITMPDTRKYRSVQKRILANTEKAVAQDCTIIDSTKLTRYPDQGGDGLHYEFPAGIPIGKAWAEQVFLQIKHLIGAENT